MEPPFGITVQSFYLTHFYHQLAGELVKNKTIVPDVMIHILDHYYPVMTGSECGRFVVLILLQSSCITNVERLVQSTF